MYRLSKVVVFSQKIRYTQAGGLISMNDAMRQVIKNAAASSTMEGLPLNQQDIKIIQDVLDGKATL